MSTKTSAVIVEARQLSIQHGARTVLAPFDWTVRAGEHWVILGANGTGKTSVLHALLGIDAKMMSQVFLAGSPLNTLSAREQAALRVWVPQHYDEPFTLTVVQALTSVAQEADDACIDRVLTCYGLHHLAQHWVHTLSGGERQRLTWAMSAARTTALTQLWLLDEPLAAQDLSWQAVLLKQLHDAPCAVVAAVHDLNQVSQFATHVLLIQKNATGAAEVIAAGLIDEVMQAEFLSAAYGVDLHLVPDLAWWQVR